MPFTYAIADLHGRYDLLSEAVTKIVEHSRSDRPATIIALGDYIDRGPKSRQVIERLMDWGSPDLKLVCLKGNHRELGVTVVVADASTPDDVDGALQMLAYHRIDVSQKISGA